MATEIDLPFLPSAAQIRRREFASVRRGYDPDQVRDYLAQVAEQVETLEQELNDDEAAAGGRPEGRTTGARVRPGALAEDPYERLSKRLATLLATADKEAEGIVAEAKVDASRMINEARSEADRIRVDAQARAEEARQQGNELLERAKQEADRVLLGLSERRETLVQHLQDMQTRLVGVAKELEVAIEDPDGIEAAGPTIRSRSRRPQHRRPRRTATTTWASEHDATRRRHRRPRGHAARRRPRRCPASRRSSSTSTTIPTTEVAAAAAPFVSAVRWFGSVRDNRGMATPLDERLAEIESRYEAVSDELASPEVVNDQERMRDLGRSFAELQEIVQPYREYRDRVGPGGRSQADGGRRVRAGDGGVLPRRGRPGRRARRGAPRASSSCC